MKIAAFSARSSNRSYLAAANEAAGRPDGRVFLEAQLFASTVPLAAGVAAVVPFDERGPRDGRPIVSNEFPEPLTRERRDCLRRHLRQHVPVPPTFEGSVA